MATNFTLFHTTTLVSLKAGHDCLLVEHNTPRNEHAVSLMGNICCWTKPPTNHNLSQSFADGVTLPEQHRARTLVLPCMHGVRTVTLHESRRQHGIGLKSRTWE